MDCIVVLIGKGADATLKNLKGQTAHDVAQQLRPRARAAVIARLNGEETDSSSRKYGSGNNGSVDAKKVHMDELSAQRLFASLLEGVGPSVRRMLALSELWGLIKYSHPYLAYRLIKWDDDAMEAIETVSNPASNNKQFLGAILRLVSKLGDPNTRVMYGNRLLTAELLAADSLEISEQIPKKESAAETSQKPSGAVPSLSAGLSTIATSSSGSPPLPGTNPAYPLVTLSDDHLAFVDFSNFDAFPGTTLASLVSTFASLDASSQGIVFDCRVLSKNKPSSNFGLFFQEAFRVILSDPIVLPIMRQRMYQGLPEHVKLSATGPSLFEHSFVVAEASILQPLSITPPHPSNPTQQGGTASPQTAQSPKQIPLQKNSKRRPMSFIIDKNTPLEVVNIAIALQSRAQACIVMQSEQEDVLQLGSEHRLVWEPGILTTDFKLSDLVERSSPTRTAAYSDIVVQVRQNERFNPDGSVGLRADQLVVVSRGTLNDASPSVLEVHPPMQFSSSNRDGTSGKLAIQSRFKLNAKANDVAVELALLFCYGKTPRVEGLRQLPFPIKVAELEYKDFDFPSKNLRLLALFRIWNAVRFFYPYKSLLPFPWEFAFIKTYSSFANAASASQYSLSIAELVALLSDAHAYVRSTHLGFLVGTHAPSIRVKQIGGTTVVTHIAALAGGLETNSPSSKKNSPRQPPLVAVPVALSSTGSPSSSTTTTPNTSIPTVTTHSSAQNASTSSTSTSAKHSGAQASSSSTSSSSSQHIIVKHASTRDSPHHAVEQLSESAGSNPSALASSSTSGSSDSHNASSSSPVVQLGVQVGDIILAVDGVPVLQRREHLASLFSLSSEQSKKWRTDMKLLAGAEGTLAKLSIKRPVTRVLDANAIKKDGEALPVKPSAETQYVEFVTEVPRSVTAQINFAKKNSPVVSVLESRDARDRHIAYVDLTRLTIAEVDAALAQVITPTVGAIIFDIRGPTKGTIFRLAPHFATHVTHVASTEVSLLLPSLLVGDIQGGMQLRGQQRCVPSTPVSSFESPMQTLTRSIKLVALINEETMSHGEYAATVLKAVRPDILFFGAPSTGSVGSVTNIPVPGGILVGFTAMGILKPDGSHVQQRGIIPDQIVLEKPESLLTGKDDIMEAALTHLRASE